MKILFWNTYNNPNINSVICDIVKEKQIDLIALAEYVGAPADLISRLAVNNISMFLYPTTGCKRITLFGTIRNVQQGAQDSRYSIQIINNSIILCCLHLPSRLYAEDEDHAIIIQRIIHDIEEHETTLHSKKSILMGDFNEDPYDSGCLSANNFHGLPSADDASRGQREVQGTLFSMFYNPMWNCFGDFSSPPGTFYHANSKAKTPFWHMFDQVLIRPCLISSFNQESLEIITKIDAISLLDNNAHPDKRYSDHLPIIFEIKEILR